MPTLTAQYLSQKQYRRDRNGGFATRRHGYEHARIQMHSGGTIERTKIPGQYRAKIKIDMSGEWRAKISFDGPRGKGETNFSVNVR